MQMNFCKAQNTLYINNDSDKPVGKIDPITITGNYSSFIITQKKTASSNYIWFEAPIQLDKAHIDSFNCQNSFFRNFIMKNCVIKYVAIFDRISSVNLYIDSNLFQNDININGRFENYKFINFSFIKNNVQGKASFSESAFNSSKFNFTTFSKPVQFDGCNFSNTLFYHVDFLDSITFSNSTYEGISFLSSNFQKTLNLSRVGFSGKVIFDSCHFFKGLIISSINPNISFSFKNIILPDTLDLSNNPVINTPIDLTDVQFHDDGKKCAIFFYKTAIDKIQIDYKYFELKFKIIDGHEMSKNEKEIVYESLLKNFKDQSSNENYELLDIEYRNFKNGWFIWPHYWDCYGYHKGWIFIWTPCFLILYTLITFLCIDNLTKFVYKINYIPNLPSLKQTMKMKHKLRVLRRRIWLSFAYTSTIFFLFLLKVENIKFKNWKGVVYLLFIYGTGLVCLAYMANFVLQK